MLDGIILIFSSVYSHYSFASVNDLLMLTPINDNKTLEKFLESKTLFMTSKSASEKWDLDLDDEFSDKIDNSV